VIKLKDLIKETLISMGQVHSNPHVRSFKSFEQINEVPIPFSSPEAKTHLSQDIKKMSKTLGKASQDVIKIMMDGVKTGKYDALDLSRGIQVGPVKSTHYGEREFLLMLWSKVRDKFRRYSKGGKLRK